MNQAWIQNGPSGRGDAAQVAYLQEENGRAAYLPGAISTRRRIDIDFRRRFDVETNIISQWDPHLPSPHNPNSGPLDPRML